MYIWKNCRRNFTVLVFIGIGLLLNAISSVHCQAVCGSTPETAGRFGINCSEVCTCAVNAACNSITGKCTGSFCGDNAVFACDKNDLTVLVIPSTRFLVDETSFMITCIVNLTPEDVTVSWQNPRGIIVTSGGKYEVFRKSETVYNLNVTNADIEDSGLYTCIATLKQPTDDLTSVQESKNVTVAFQGRIFEFPATVIRKLPRENLLLTCKALFAIDAKSSSLHWTWSEDAVDSRQIVEAKIPVQYFTTTNTTKVILTRTLAFSNLTANMSGTFACSASENGNNESDRKEVELFVVEPAEIEDLHLNSITPSSLYFTWNTVSTGNDHILCTARYCLDENCTAVHCMNETACNITGLSPYITYNISVVCDNYAGSSIQLTFFDAKTAVSGPLSPLNPDVEDSYSFCNITWKESRKANGPGRIYYQIRHTVARRDNLQLEAQFYTEKIYDNKFFTPKNQLDLNSVYAFDICAGNDVHLGGCISANETCVTDFGVPDSVPDLRLEDNTGSVTSSSFTIVAPVVDDRNGPISCYEFVVLESEENSMMTNPDHDYHFKNIQDKPLNRSLPYRAIVLTREQFKDTTALTIGGEKYFSSVCHLSSVSSKKKRSDHMLSIGSTLKATNEALKADAGYKIFMRVYVATEDGTSRYVSSRYLQVTTTKNGGIALIVVIILSAIIAITSVLFLSWIIRRRHRVQKKTITHYKNDRQTGGYVNQGFHAGTSSYLSLQSMKTTGDLSSSSYLSLKPILNGIHSVQTSADIAQNQSVATPEPPLHDDDYLEMKGNIKQPPREDLYNISSNEVTEVRENGEEEYIISTKADVTDHSIQGIDAEIEGGEGDKEIDYEEISNEVDDDYSRVLYEKLEAPVPFQLSELTSYIDQRKGSGPKSLEREFELLPKGQQEPWTVAEKEENASKNRFPDILPYDHTRVKLLRLQNDSSSDYYNASFITDQFNKTSFIAAQGPGSLIVEDFWRMVWQEHVKVIVMVTNLEEQNKQLCVQYWPDDVGGKIVFGGISIELISSENFSNFQIRNMQVQKETEPPVRVSQFHYLSWPYLKVPTNTRSLLSFTKLVKEAQLNVQAPTLIHCSDGAGATGTFLALYCLLDDLSKDNEICVYDFVKKLRKSRLNMVQTKTQYVCIYNTLLEAHLSPQSALTAEELEEIDISSERLLGEFQVLQTLPSTSCKKLKGALEENKDKNRCSEIIPPDERRPTLTTQSLMGGNDYINALTVDSFLQKNAYILTQSPLPTTVEDFWRLVFDYQCRTIVVLHRIDGCSKAFPYYWPRGGSVQYGSMAVENIGEEYFEGFTKRNFTVSHLENMTSRPVTQIHLNSWETDNPSSLGDFFRTAEKYQEHPTLVHCLNECGIFVTVQSELQRLRHMGRIDIFSRVRELGGPSPYIIPKMEDYVHCYKILKYMVTTERADNELRGDAILGERNNTG